MTETYPPTGPHPGPGTPQPPTPHPVPPPRDFERIAHRAVFDQAAALAMDSVIEKAREYDGLDMSDAAALMTAWLLESVTSAGIAATLAHLAIRTARELAIPRV